MKKLLAINLCLFCYATSSLGQSDFDLTNIPDSIKNNASVITQLEDFDLKVESLDKINLKVHEVYTVLNEEGKDKLIFNEYTSKYVSLDEAEVKVYDANGKQIEKFKKKDMMTTAVGEGLIEDGYVVFRPVTTNVYPVTIEFKYEQTIKSTLIFPDFRFMGPKEGIIQANYTVRLPAEIPLRYKSLNATIQPTVTNEGDNKIYKWTVKNIPPIEYEQGTVSPRSKYPYVAVVLDNFSHYGIRGNLSSWKNFGLWIRDLYKDLDVLPPDRQQFFLQLTNDAVNTEEKIRRVYSYLQQNFRYVSIQLGIGGLKPFSAQFTDQKKYGDCKALSNYMKAVLKAIGITSYVAIINAEYNEEPVSPDFPSNDFNHVILCVPGQKDSLWLECTSSTTAFGELGTFTENRNALLVTDEGGVLVATPRSQSSENIFSSHSLVTMADDLSAEIETIFTTKGEYSGRMKEILQEKSDEQKKDIVFYLGSKQPDLFEISDDRPDDNKAKLNMKMRRVIEFNTGNKFFLNPRTYKMWSAKLPKSENRKFDFYFHYPFEKRDTTIFKLPAGYTPDVLPAEKELKCKYGWYKTRFWYNEPTNSIYSATAFVLTQHKIPAADYASVKKFFDDVVLDDSQRIVIKKAEGDKKAF